MTMRLCRCLMWMLIVPGALLQGAAQQLSQPTLKQVLTVVQENYAAYLKTVPNLYAQERMLSNVTFITSPQSVLGADPHGRDQHVTYDSLYRLRRVSGAVDQRELEETRQLAAIDHQPVSPDQKLTAPYLVTDPQYAPNVFWPDWGPCFDYKLAASRKWQGRKVWVLEYATAHKAGLHDKCPLKEPVAGRALIDPETMTMVRFEQRRPRHAPEMSTIQTLKISPESFGDWQCSIDYAPVTLHGKSYWLPKTITSTFELFDKQHVLWSSVSNYSHYQLAYVDSKILLPDGTELKKQ